VEDHQITAVLAEYLMAQSAGRRLEKAPSPDFPIIESGLIDSLGLFKLVSYIESQFGVKISPDEVVFENFVNIQTIAGLIQAKLSTQSDCLE
jgi:acyl carrier protein